MANKPDKALPFHEPLGTESPYLTARQAAAYLNIAYNTFKKKAKLIKVMPGTGRYRIEDLDAYAEGKRAKRTR